MGVLPEEEVAEPLLSRITDDDIGIGLAVHVEVRAGALRGEARCELLEGVALGVMLGDDAADGVDDLALMTAADHEIDREGG